MAKDTGTSTTDRKRWRHRTPWQHRQPEPRTIKEAAVAISANRRSIRHLALGLAAIALVMPVLTVLVLTIGQRGRDDNCAVVERTFLGYNRHLANGLVMATDRGQRDAEDLERLAGTVERFVTRLDDDVAELMEGCG